jgi:hypothetical protein
MSAKAKRDGSRRRATELFPRAGYAREQARSSPPSRFSSREGLSAATQAAAARLRSALTTTRSRPVALAS